MDEPRLGGPCPDCGRHHNRFIGCEENEASITAEIDKIVESAKAEVDQGGSMKGIPEKIWLQADPEYQNPQQFDADITWCEDQINNNDIEYVRADSVRVEIERLTKIAKLTRDFFDETNETLGLLHMALCEYEEGIETTKNCTCEPDELMIKQGCPVHDPGELGKDTK